jgi:hypothetical protein
VYGAPGHPPLISEITRVASARGNLCVFSVRLLPVGALAYTQPAASAAERRLLSLAPPDAFASLRELSIWMPTPLKYDDDAPPFDPSPLAPLVGRLETLKLRFEVGPEAARAFRPLLPTATSLKTLVLVAWPRDVAPPALAGLTALVGGALERRYLREHAHTGALTRTLATSRHATSPNPVNARPRRAPRPPHLDLAAAPRASAQLLSTTPALGPAHCPPI